MFYIYYAEYEPTCYECGGVDYTNEIQYLFKTESPVIAKLAAGTDGYYVYSPIEPTVNRTLEVTEEWFAFIEQEHKKREQERIKREHDDREYAKLMSDRNAQMERIRAQQDYVYHQPFIYNRGAFFGGT